MQRCTSSRHCISASECEGCIKYAPQFSRVCSQLTDTEAEPTTVDSIEYDLERYNINIHTDNNYNYNYTSNYYVDIRATFALDRVLYRDGVLEVSPCGVYIVRAKRWLDIAAVTCVSVRERAKPPLRKPTLLQRLSLDPAVRARAPHSVAVPNVYLRLQQEKRTVAVCAEWPHEVKEAVDHAKKTVY